MHNRQNKVTNGRFAGHSRSYEQADRGGGNELICERITGRFHHQEETPGNSPELTSLVHREWGEERVNNNNTIDCLRLLSSLPITHNIKNNNLYLDSSSLSNANLLTSSCNSFSTETLSCNTSFPDINNPSNNIFMVNDYRVSLGNESGISSSSSSSCTSHCSYTDEQSESSSSLDLTLNPSELSSSSAAPYNSIDYSIVNNISDDLRYSSIPSLTCNVFNNNNNDDSLKILYQNVHSIKHKKKNLNVNMALNEY